MYKGPSFLAILHSRGDGFAVQVENDTYLHTIQCVLDKDDLEYYLPSVVINRELRNEFDRYGNGVR